MYVVKRDGRKEPVMFDKITARVRKLCYGLNNLVDPVKVAMRVIEGLYDGVTTSELDNLAAETAAAVEGQNGANDCARATVAAVGLRRSNRRNPQFTGHRSDPDRRGRDSPIRRVAAG